ncbi:MAG TPA: BatD family protein, partial [Phycisphaerae bacterium]
FQVIPKHAGKLSIPAVKVRVDGEERSIDIGDIIVSESDTEDLLYVELTGDRRTVYVGEAVETTLEIWIRPFVQGDYRMSIQDMFRCLDVEHSSWGEFKDLLNSAQNFRGRSAVRKDSAGNDRAYYVIALTKRLWAEQPGPLEAGDIRIVVNYPVHLRRSRDFFSILDEGITVGQQRPISAVVTSQAIQVKPLPTAGAPLFFNGAVGRYQMEATAKPTKVHVGDPITLSIAIRGEGRLDTLSPPPLARLDNLTEHFRVPDEPLAGDVEGNSKRFTQSIRARSADVTEIPPIPFAYFDPQAEKYVTVSSNPIPIEVEASEAASTALVGTSDSASAPTTTLTDVGGGMLANYTGSENLLSQQVFAPGWGSAAAAIIPPLSFAVCWLTQRRSQRLRTDVAYARRRSAARRALRAIHAARDTGAPDRAVRVADALLDYVADRCNVPARTLTRAEAIQHLQSRGADSMLVHRTNELLVECEQALYAGMSAGDGVHLTATARQCIEELEREWR